MVNVHDNAAQNAHAAPRGAQGVQHESDCGTRDSGAQGANMTVGSLFSGIGGMDLGLERAGMRVQWQVEIDPWCRKVLAKHWPDVPKYGDVRTVNWDDIERVDVLCGGFPCQDISIAGVGAGLSGQHSGLWTEFAAAIRAIQPRYVIVENSPALPVRGLDAILADLAGIGYDAEWHCLPAAAFSAPHLRARTWILAYPGRIGDRMETPAICTGRDVPQHSDWWASEPDMVRVAHGIPRRVDRLRGLGNAVVPQVVEYIGKRIVAHARQEATP